MIAQASREGASSPEPESAPISRQLSSPFSRGERLGQLVLVPDAGELELQVARSVSLLRTVVALLALGLGLALALTVHLSIVRPLTNLSNQLHQIGGGKGRQLDLPRGHEEDEIGQLVGDTNALMHNLLLSSTDLHNANTQL